PGKRDPLKNPRSFGRAAKCFFSPSLRLSVSSLSILSKLIASIRRARFQFYTTAATRTRMTTVTLKSLADCIAPQLAQVEKLIHPEISSDPAAVDTHV